MQIIRKNKYIIYKQIATFAVNIAQQTRNNINPQMIEQFIQGPQSPLKLNDEVERITEEACTAVGTTRINKNIQHSSIMRHLKDLSKIKILQKWQKKLKEITELA